MIPNGNNGYVRWPWFITTVIGLAVLCMGATWQMLKHHKEDVYDVLKVMQVDLREVRADVKDLLKKGG